MLILLLVALIASALGSGPSPGPALEPLPAVLREPRIVVVKSRRQLQLFSRHRLVRTYRVGLGLNPVPPKTRAGDRATPEGRFYVCLKNPHSQFFMSLGLSYPSPADAEQGLRAGLITAAQRDRILAAQHRHRVPPWDTALGGEVFIHGNGSSTDWTWGCVALDDPDMRELFAVTPIGTPVTILP
jgi:murein L,D-transpeptidase YafK